MSVPPALSSSPTSDNYDSDSSDYSFDETVLPPSYNTLFSSAAGLASPASSIGTSPADSFNFGKAHAALPLLSPSLESPAAVSTPAAADSLLSKLFPSTSAVVHTLPATAVKVDDLVGAEWKGCVVNDAAAGLRTLYIGGGRIEDLELREAIMDVADRAEEQWGVTGIVLALEKETADLGSLVHGLTYVGFTAVHKPETNPSMLLLALDLL